MPERRCEYVVGWNFESEGDPVCCERLARCMLVYNWYCADHYDVLIATAIQNGLNAIP